MLRDGSFDNMQDRSIRGTTDWTRYDVVLNVPENAAMMKFGFLSFSFFCETQEHNKNK